MSGSVKLWDITAQKNVVNFSGHKGNATVLCQNPTRPSVWASASLDSTVRLWDARVASSLATYQVHSKSVTAIEFSPHGAWIATGSEDCSSKILDIPAGGQARGIVSGHLGAVSDVRFHPNEYLLATASLDKTVRFWDLESFECVSQSDSAGGPVHKIGFHPAPPGCETEPDELENNTKCLFAAAETGIRLLGWEPARLYAHLTAISGWQRNGILDLAVSQNGDTLLCLCKTDENRLAVFQVDVTKLRPFSPLSCLSQPPAAVASNLTSTKSVPDLAPKSADTSSRPCAPIHSSQSTAVMADAAPTPEFSRGKRMRRSFHEQQSKSCSSSDESSSNSSPEHQVGGLSKQPAAKSAAADAVMAKLASLASEEDAFKPMPRVRISPPSTPVLRSAGSGDLTPQPPEEQPKSGGQIVFENAMQGCGRDPLAATFTVVKIEHKKEPSLSGLRPKDVARRATSPVTNRKSLVPPGSCRSLAGHSSSESTLNSSFASGPRSVGPVKVKPTGKVAPQPAARRTSSASAINTPQGGNALAQSFKFHPPRDIGPLGEEVRCGGGGFDSDGGVGSLPDERLVSPEEFLPEHFAGLSLETSNGGDSGLLKSGYSPSVANEQSVIAAVENSSKAMTAVLQHRANHLELIAKVGRKKV